MPASLNNQPRPPTTTPVGTYAADFLIWYASSGLAPLLPGALTAVRELPPPPLPHEPRIISPAITGELTLRLSKACSYSQRILPLSGSNAEMPCDWLLTTMARSPAFGSNTQGVE